MKKKDNLYYPEDQELLQSKTSDDKKKQLKNYKQQYNA